MYPLLVVVVMLCDLKELSALLQPAAGIQYLIVHFEQGGNEKEGFEGHQQLRIFGILPEWHSLNFAVMCEGSEPHPIHLPVCNRQNKIYYNKFIIQIFNNI